MRTHKDGIARPTQLVTLVCLIVICVFAFACQGSSEETCVINQQPAWSPSGNQLAFVSDAYGFHQVWVVSSNGTGLTRLSGGNDQDMNPAWDPSGTLIYFIRWDENGIGKIWRMNSDGTNKVAVTATNYSEFDCSVSPDGLSLLAATTRGIVRYSSSGAVEKCVAASGEDDQPDYAPDGTRMVYIRKGNVWVRNLDGSGLVQLTTGNHFESTPRWCPDGLRIVFASDRQGDTRRLWFVQPDGANLQRVFNDETEPATVSDSDPSWSRDSAKIAFSREDAESCAIWTANANGTGLTQVTHTVATPQFSPEAGTYSGAQTVTITCDSPGAIIRYTTDGSEPTVASPVYSAPLLVDHSLTLKARGWKTDWFPSHVRSGDYVIE